jgi:ubiquinone/menaquinone biosynthesis C-methylase UbiE
MYVRKRRHRALCRLIDSLPRPVKTLDVGGTPFFWESVKSADRCDITILNKESSDNAAEFKQSCFQNFRMILGDACDMQEIPTKSYDLVICNSVIEHVGSWPAMTSAAKEVFRVGRHGWVQIPAFEFPLEPHLMLPFIHWIKKETQRTIVKSMIKNELYDKLNMISEINLVTRKQMHNLFPGVKLHTEWLFSLPKSHMATW